MQPQALYLYTRLALRRAGTEATTGEGIQSPLSAGCGRQEQQRLFAGLSDGCQGARAVMSMRSGDDVIKMHG